MWSASSGSPAGCSTPFEEGDLHMKSSDGLMEALVPFEGFPE